MRSRLSTLDEHRVPSTEYLREYGARFVDTVVVAVVVHETAHITRLYSYYLYMYA